MGMVHLEAHLAAVSSGFQQVAAAATAAAKAATAAKQLTDVDLTNLAIEGVSGKSNKDLLKSIAGSGIGGYLDTLTAVIKDLRDPKISADRRYRDQKAIEGIEQLIRMFYPGFLESAFETSLKKVLADREQKAQQARAAAPGGASGAAGFTFRIVNRNGTPTIDILPDSGKVYDPKDPNYQLLISTGKIGGG